MQFSIRRASLAVAGIIATAGMISLTATTGAGAAPTDYQPPELTFTATGPHEITATIHNPNASGICYVTIGIDTSIHEFAEHDGTGYAPAGQTIRVTRHDLTAGSYRLGGLCGASATAPGQVRATDQYLTLPGDEPATGSGGVR